MKPLVVIPMLAILVSAGVVGLYFYTTAPSGVVPNSGMSSTTGSVSQSGSQPGGTQDANGRPQGVWASYLGYIPSGYVLAPHESNAPNFPCPPDMTSSACAKFGLTCGNGVCDPNERCDTCPIDCAPTGNLVCDPYTGRGGSPSSVCQAYVNGQNFG